MAIVPAENQRNKPERWFVIKLAGGAPEKKTMERSNMFLLLKKNFSNLISIALILTMIFSLNLSGFYVKAQGVEPPKDSTAEKAPEGYQPVNTPVTNTFTERIRAVGDTKNILLIEDVNPWTTTQHHTILRTFGTLKKVSSTAALNEDFHNYDLVILSNDQYESTYANYEKYRSNMEEYISSGGVVIFGNTFAGWNTYVNINKKVYTLPVPVTQIFMNKIQRNKISNPHHPIVTASLTNNIPLRDADLVHTGGVSYSRFNENMMPKGGSVIIRDSSDGATLIEYPFGRGTVLASEIVWEYDLHTNGTYARKALKDLYAYALSKSAVKFTFDISSAVVEPGEIVDITVSMRNNPGFAGLDLDFSFENFGRIANLKPISITPLNDFTTGIFTSNLDALNAGANIDWNKEKIITVTWSDADNTVTADADLFTIRFDISNAALNGIYGLDVNGTVINQFYETVEYGRRPGSITVYQDDPTNFLYGDTHFNNLVEIRDATRLSQFLVSMVAMSVNETRAANVHYDLENEIGIIDIKDAIKLSQWLADYDNIILGDGPDGSGPGRKPTK